MKTNQSIHLRKRRDDVWRIWGRRPLVVNATLCLCTSGTHTHTHRVNDEWSTSRGSASVAHCCPHCLSRRPVRLLNSPLWPVLAGLVAVALRRLSGCCPTPTLILSSTHVVPVWRLLEVCQPTVSDSTSSSQVNVPVLAICFFWALVILLGGVKIRKDE